MTDPTPTPPVHGCTINGQPAIPIPVSDYNQLTADLAALRAVARGYCPHCGRGDAAPSVEDWEQQKQRGDHAEAALAHLQATSEAAGILLTRTTDERDQLADELEETQQKRDEEREMRMDLGRDIREWVDLAGRHQHWGQRRWHAWLSARARAQQKQATIARIRRLVEDVADTTAAGISDYDIGRHETASAVLDILDAQEPS